MSSYNHDAICTIYGIIILQTTRPHELKNNPSLKYRCVWRGLAIALSGPSWLENESMYEVMNVPSEHIHCQVVEANGFHGELCIMPDGPTIVPQNSYAAGSHRSHNLHTREHWFFGIHSACLVLARRVMEISPNASIQTIGDLWVTLERRCSKTGQERWFSWKFVPNIPDNPPGEPIELNLRRYYVPRDHIGIEQDDDAEDWVCINY